MPGLDAAGRCRSLQVTYLALADEFLVKICGSRGMFTEKMGDNIRDDGMMGLLESLVWTSTIAVYSTWNSE
jgi:hypothetical protein